MAGKVATAFALLAVAAVHAAPGTAPLVEPPAGAEKTGTFIVKLDSTDAQTQRSQIEAVAKAVGVENVTAWPEFNLMAVKATPEQLSIIRNHPYVARVEYDQVVTAAAAQDRTLPPTLVATEPAPAKEVKNPLWGLDRINQRERNFDGKFTAAADGEGVDAYILDTGVRITHEQFDGRASYFWTAYQEAPVTKDNPNGFVEGWNKATGEVGPKPFHTDDGGHGTHVAGTVGGRDYGVAPKVSIKAVKVLATGKGSSEGVIAGLYSVLKFRNKSRPAVINMSLGGLRFDSAEGDALTVLVKDNVAAAVSAGNDAIDACNNSPAYTPAAITVGSTTVADELSSFSNYGPCVDILAPGSDIFSSYHKADNATTVMSGTSMAGPHVAGALAVLRSQFPSAKTVTDPSGEWVADKDEVRRILLGTTTSHAISKVPVCPSTVNQLLNVNFAGVAFKAIATTKADVFGADKKDDAWCRANIDSIESRTYCAFQATNKCRATGKNPAVTDLWCQQANCAAAYVEAGLCMV